MLKKKWALALLRTQLEGRREREYWSCRKFGYLVCNCKTKKKEKKKKKEKPQNRYKILVTRSIQYGVRDKVKIRQQKRIKISQMATYWFVIGWFDNQSAQKIKLDKQQKMLLSLRFIFRHTVLKYIIVVNTNCLEMFLVLFERFS